MRKLLLIGISVLLFLPNLFTTDFFAVPVYNRQEVYDPSLAYINSIDQLEKHIDSVAAIKKIDPASLDYMEIVSNTIKQRFYHGYSHLSMNENWIASLSGKYIWEDLSCTVQPADIILHEFAACSQQELVFMALLRRKKVAYRSVIFPHHYALEVQIKGKWYFFDTNMEPTIEKESRMEDNWKASADSLKKYYDTGRYNNLDYTFGVNHPLIYGPVNEVPAPKARIFQECTKWISKILWLLPLLWVFYTQRPKNSA